MKQVRMHGARDVRVDEVDAPTIQEPTDAIIKISAACICGSDLWPYRGYEPITEPTTMGHEYVGVVDSVGDEVTTLKPGQMVVGSFVVSDYANPDAYFMSNKRIEQIGFMNHSQAEYLRVPFADGMLVPVDFTPDAEQLASLLAASDVFGTGWHGAVAANVKPGSSVVVVGDGAVGLSAVLAAKTMGAGQIIAMSRHADRQALAQEFGATDIVPERGDAGVAKVHELTGGLGADSVIEAVGMSESVHQALMSARPGGSVGFVGVPHGVTIPAASLFFLGIHLHGGPAPVRKYLPEIIELIKNKTINPGKVFTTTLPLSQAGEGYRLMDERKAIKVMLDPTQ